MSAGMLLLLSISATKRETYLLPLLPLLFLWLGIRSDQWWQRWQLLRASQLELGWWLQVALLCVYCLLPPLAAWVYLGSARTPILIALLFALVPVSALLYVSASADRRRAGVWMLIAAFAGNGIILALAPPLLNDTKDMGPFVQAIGRRLPPGQPVYAVNMDETLAAEIPFYTGRRAVAVDTQSLPQWLLVQDNHEDKMLALAPDYLLVAQRSFGPRRSLMLWQARDSAGHPEPIDRCPSLVSDAIQPTRLAVFWLGLALLWFVPLNSPHLFDPDEGRYAEIPREMVASGDWVTPRLDAIKYFEKPALGYWATAVAFEIFGQHAWTVRLWPALSAMFGLMLTFALGRRLYDQRAALLAVVVQASALLYVALARIATLDMGLSFGLQIAMTALALLVHAPRPGERPLRALPLLLGVGVALAVLSKGLVGILIPGAVGVLFMLIHRDWRLPLRAQPWWTLAALLLLAAPWFVLVSARNPEFAHFFFIFQHFQRYLSRAEFDRYQPVWFFLPVLALGFLPWTTLLPEALRQAGARRAPVSAPPRCC